MKENKMLARLTLTLLVRLLHLQLVHLKHSDHRERRLSLYADTKLAAQSTVMQVPPQAKFVVDLGTGDGDGAAATATLRPAARVVGVDASPFMIIAGRRQNRQVANLEWRHALAERTGLADGCADAVTITLVLHECSDAGKLDIAKEAARILKPGGVLVVADTPQDDLATYRGFYEPHREV